MRAVNKHTALILYGKLLCYYIYIPKTQPVLEFPMLTEHYVGNIFNFWPADSHHFSHDQGQRLQLPHHVQVHCLDPIQQAAKIQTQK